MPRAGLRRATTTAAAFALLAPAVAVMSAGPAHAATGSSIASLAVANVGKGAGTCSHVNSSDNSLGGAAFYGSCTGNDGSAEYWCADFARWVWSQSGVDIAGLDAAAGSFVADASQNGSTVHSSSSYTPQVGDAIVYNYNGAGYADHVGLVTAVNSDGSITTANGDFGGVSGDGEAYFAETSKVESVTIAESQRSVGSTPSAVGMTISDYVTPGGLTSSAAAASYESSPVVAYGSQMQVFGAGSAGTSYSDVYSPGKGWSGWTSLGGTIADDPTSVEYDTQAYGAQLEVFGRTSGGSTYSKVYTPNSGWSGWMDIGGDITSDPVAIQYGEQMEVYGIAASGATYSDVYTPGKGWSGWEDLGGNLVGGLSVLNYGTQLQVFGRSAGGTTYSNVYTPGKGWSGWTSLGGTLAGNPTAVEYDTSTYGNQVEVYGLAAGGATWSDVYSPGKGWSGWNSIGGDLTGNVTPVVYGSQMEVFGRGSGGTAYSDVYTIGKGWSGWTSLGGTIADDPTPIVYGSQMQVYGRAAGGATWSDVYTPGSGWSGWTSLGGDLQP
jgi:hypothetical protein